MRRGSRLLPEAPQRGGEAASPGCVDPMESHEGARCGGNVGPVVAPGHSRVVPQHQCSSIHHDQCSSIHHGFSLRGLPPRQKSSLSGTLACSTWPRRDVTRMIGAARCVPRCHMAGAPPPASQRAGAFGAPLPRPPCPAGYRRCSRFLPEWVGPRTVEPQRYAVKAAVHSALDVIVVDPPAHFVAPGIAPPERATLAQPTAGSPAHWGFSRRWSSSIRHAPKMPPPLCTRP